MATTLQLHAGPRLSDEPDVCYLPTLSRQVPVRRIVQRLIQWLNYYSVVIDGWIVVSMSMSCHFSTLLLTVQALARGYFNRNVSSQPVDLFTTFRPVIPEILPFPRLDP